MYPDTMQIRKASGLMLAEIRFAESHLSALVAYAAVIQASPWEHGIRERLAAEGQAALLSILTAINGSQAFLAAMDEWREAVEMELHEAAVREDEAREEGGGDGVS